MVCRYLYGTEIGGIDLKHHVKDLKGNLGWVVERQNPTTKQKEYCIDLHHQIDPSDGKFTSAGDFIWEKVKPRARRAIAEQLANFLEEKRLKRGRNASYRQTHKNKNESAASLARQAKASSKTSDNHVGKVIRTPFKQHNDDMSTIGREVGSVDFSFNNSQGMQSVGLSQAKDLHQLIAMENRAANDFSKHSGEAIGILAGHYFGNMQKRERFRANYVNRLTARTR